MRRNVLFFVLTVLIPAWEGFSPRLEAAGGVATRPAGCRKVVLEGEVAAGQEWRREMGEGWVFRVVPIGGVAGAGIAAAGVGYSGWDLAMDREQGGGYPDGLLLATPPYGSLNPREVGTTYGMRAQDAIAWEPRRFRFLTTKSQWLRARTLYGEVMAEAAGDGGKAGANAGHEAAARELLRMASGGAELGSGEFEILDARLVAGVGDPPSFARQWAADLARVPHSLLPAGDSAGTGATALGQLRWIRFRATLLVPGGWRLPRNLSGIGAKCAE